MIGNFTGHSLVVDPVSGFLIKSNHAVDRDVKRREDGTYAESPFDGTESVLVFGPDQKLEFLRIASELWPNITAVCDRIGIDRDTYRNHYAVDEKFRRECDLIRDRTIDRIENVRMTVAHQPSGSFDRMCVLNAYRPEVYNPKVKIEIEHTVSREEGARRLNVLSQAVDAEIVDTVQKIKAQRARARRRQNPNGHGDPK
jgi:hypothetical protein